MPKKYEDILETLKRDGVVVEGWMLKLPEILERYLEEEPSVDIKVLSREYGVPVSTLYFWFKKLGISRKRRKGKDAIGEVLRRKEIESLKEEAEKLGTLALGLGGVIARRYTPLLDYELAHGNSLEFIAEDIMSWYENKRAVQTRTDKLETENTYLTEKLGEAYALAAPNLRYILRAKLLKDYTLRLLQLKALGMKIPLKQSMQAFKQDLLALDNDLVEAMEVKIENEQQIKSSASG